MKLRQEKRYTEFIKIEFLKINQYENFIIPPFGINTQPCNALPRIYFLKFHGSSFLPNCANPYNY